MGSRFAMRRFVVLAIGVVVFGQAVIGFAAADFHEDDDDEPWPDPTIGITTLGGTDCIMLDAAREPAVVAERYHRVLTPWKGETDPDQLKCFGYVPNPTGKRLVFESVNFDVICGLGTNGQFGGVDGNFFKQTSAWRQVISPSGMAILSCRD